MTENASYDSELGNDPRCLGIYSFDQVFAEHFIAKTGTVIGINMLYPVKELIRQYRNRINSEVSAL